MEKILITGCNGFLAEEIIKFYQGQYYFVGIDRLSQKKINNIKNFKFYRFDIFNKKKLQKLFKKYKFKYVFHFAAELLDEKNKKKIWNTNYESTKKLIDLSKKFKVKKFIFTSTFSIFTKNYNYKITENEKDTAMEDYGMSKLAAEKYLMDHSYKEKIIIFRCPVIIGKGRLDKFGILFDLVNLNINLWLIGNGENKVHYIYSHDIATAIKKSLKIKGPEIFNIGSDNVKSTKKIFQKLLKSAESNKKVKCFPKFFGLFILKFLHLLNLIPFGPYHQKILVSNIVLDTKKIKKTLNWKPTLTNEQMLIECYKDYKKNLKNRKYTNDSSSKKKISLGILKLMKYLP